MLTMKKCLVIALLGLQITLFAMEKELIQQDSDSCLATLLSSFDTLALQQKNDAKNHKPQKLERLEAMCWKVVDKQKKTEVGKAIEKYCKNHRANEIIFELVKKALASKKAPYIVHIVTKVPIDLYPKICFEILNSNPFLHEKAQIFEALCWAATLDFDTKRILKMFKSYCKKPVKFNYTYYKAWTSDEIDMQAFNLSWRGLLDIKSDAPYQLLLHHKKLLIPGQIINYLLKMNQGSRKVHSIHEAQQILQRLHVVLERGASPDTNLELDSETSFNYVLQKAKSFIGSGSELGESLYFYRFDWLNSQEVLLHALFFKKVLTLFVEHVKMRGWHLFLKNKNYEKLPTDQIVEYLITHPHNRNCISYQQIIPIDYK